MGPLWLHFNRIIKFSGAIVLHATQPFTSNLIMSNLGMFKYCWVWDKTQSPFPYNAEYQPMKVHEDIVVFSFAPAVYTKDKYLSSMDYYPQITYGHKNYTSGVYNKNKIFHSPMKKTKNKKNNSGERYPRSIIRFNKQKKPIHPTQKPISLAEYLIETYTEENNLVLDCCAGSGTVGIACQNLNRKYILIEKEKKYYDIAEKKLKKNG